MRYTEVEGIDRFELKNGVFLSELEDARFKKRRTLVAFVEPCSRDDIAETALLPYILSRGTSECPDMTLLSRKLARLYGAIIGKSAVRIGLSRGVYASIEGVRGALVDEPSLEAQYEQLIFDTMFSPHLEDGVFSREWIEIEKQKLKQSFKAVYNDKRAYCLKLTAKAFYGPDSLRALDASDFEDELDAVTPERLYAVYKRLCDTAKVEVVSVGSHASKGVFERIAPRTAPALPAPPIVEKKETERVFFDDEVDQQKLAMCFTCARELSARERAAFRVGAALFGMTPTSRLFTNVREKKSLCYDCGASPNLWEGTMCVDSGVERGNERKLERAVMAELRSIADGKITDAELSQTKLALENALLGVDDSVGGLESWYFGQLLAGRTPVSPRAVLEESVEVTAGEVAEVMGLFNLNVVGCLGRRE